MWTGEDLQWKCIISTARAVQFTFMCNCINARISWPVVWGVLEQGLEGWWRCWPARSASLCVKHCPQAWSSGPRRDPPYDATRPGPPGTHPGSTGHPAPPAAQAGHLKRQKLSLQIVFGIGNLIFTLSEENMSGKSNYHTPWTLVRRAARWGGQALIAFKQIKGLVHTWALCLDFRDSLRDRLSFHFPHHIITISWAGCECKRSVKAKSKTGR